jgi:hypothetical protein
VTSTTAFLHHWFSSCLVSRSVWCFFTLLCAHLELGLIVSSHSMILSWFVCRSVVGLFLSFADRSVCWIWNHWWNNCSSDRDSRHRILMFWSRVLAMGTTTLWMLFFFLAWLRRGYFDMQKKEIQHKACVSWKDHQRLGGVREPGFRVLNCALNGISAGKLVWACAAQTERDRDRGAEMASVLPSTTHDALYDNAKFRHRSSLRVSNSSKQHRGRLQTFQLMLKKNKR